MLNGNVLALENGAFGISSGRKRRFWMLPLCKTRVATQTAISCSSSSSWSASPSADSYKSNFTLLGREYHSTNPFSNLQ